MDAHLIDFLAHQVRTLLTVSMDQSRLLSQQSATIDRQMAVMRKQGDTNEREMELARLQASRLDQYRATIVRLHARLHERGGA